MHFKYVGYTDTHNIGATDNGDYSGYQLIYSKHGDRVSSEENKGTFDFISPSISPRGHAQIDVRPWIEWGKSPIDSSIRQDRIGAMQRTIDGREGLRRMGYPEWNN